MPVVWTFRNNIASSEKELADDPRAIIKPFESGSMLRLRNTTVEDNGEYICSLKSNRFNSVSARVVILPGMYENLNMFLNLYV